MNITKVLEWILDLFEPITDADYLLKTGVSFRFVLANLIMQDELRPAIAFAKHDIKMAVKYMDISPDFCKRKLNRACKDLSELFGKEGD